MNEIEKLNMISEWQEQHKQLIEDLDNSKKRIEELEEIIKKLIQNRPDTYSGTDIETQQKKMFAFMVAVNKAEEFLKIL